MEEIFGVVILLAIFFGAKYLVRRERKNSIEFTQQIRSSILQKCDKIIKNHIKELAVQRHKSCYNDAYGKLNETQWLEKEIPYFFEHHIVPKLNQEQQVHALLFKRDIFERIDKSARIAKLPVLKFDSKMTGFQFEQFCTELLKEEGWQVDKTKNGADQGVDLIVRKGSKFIGVQCKKYARPVGNKAVQEIKAGISHYNLSHGVVLTNNKFTKSAVELAQTNNIHLLHYQELEKLKYI